LIGINASTKADASRTREDRLREAGVEHKVLVGEHPVVRTHPETGRKALYVNVGHTTHFKDWTEQESEPLLGFLFAHQVRPEFSCRFHWEPGSLAFWDNRCTQHNPVNDYHGFRRVMHRVTLAGEAPV
jgi:taurine dioxygenase